MVIADMGKEVVVFYSGTEVAPIDVFAYAEQPGTLPIDHALDPEKFPCIGVRGVISFLPKFIA